MKVLIADDNVDARMSLALLLEHMGHVVRFASDGGEAMAIMGQDRPDLVILDLMMPRINGWEFLDSKAMSQWADVPVIICSGWTQIEQPIPDNAGVVATFKKGEDMENILALLQSNVSRSKE